MFVTSGDNGNTFSSSKRISADNWVIDGCPHTGPSLTSNRLGTHALWYTEGTSSGIFYSYAENPSSDFVTRESISSMGKHPQIAAHSDNVALLWEENVTNGSESHSRIRYQVRGGAGMRSDYVTLANTDSYFPVITTAGTGFITAYLMKVNEVPAVFMDVLH
jgi:hypothetical protein